MDSDVSPMNMFKGKPPIRGGPPKFHDDIPDEEEEVHHMNTAEFNQFNMKFDQQDEDVVYSEKTSKASYFNMDKGVQFPEEVIDV